MPERPRDRLGRPLAADADPSLVAPAVPDATDLTDAEIWELAGQFLDSAMPFHAHEVFEARWRSADPAERNAWRALAQWGAALTQDARGNTVGAVRLAERALVTLAQAEQVPSCVDVPAVTASCHRLIEQDAPRE